MSNTPDALPATAPEGQPREYTPTTDPLMHRVTVIDEFIPGQKAERMGYQTNILGAKVDLQALGENNKTRRESSGCYDTIYFRTISGTIYRLDNLVDGSWRAESSNYPQDILLEASGNLEVGQRFITSRDTAGNATSYTSSIQEITLVDRQAGTEFHGVRFSQRETDIARDFKQVRRVKRFSV